MTEPVGYLHQAYKNKKERYLEFGISDNKNFDSIPLYTEDQLHPRVKMTQKQYDRLMWDKENTDLLTCLGYFLEHDKFGLPSENLMGFLKQEDIARAWLNPQETIEIVPNMKWFVEKKKFNGDYKFLKINEKDLRYNHLKEQATQFDTKEEAEKWTNPLTEAVQLPVEGE